MNDRAAKAAERIDDIYGGMAAMPYNEERVKADVAAIIRAEYANETLMQARAEHLEAVLAKVMTYLKHQR